MTLTAGNQPYAENKLGETAKRWKITDQVTDKMLILVMFRVYNTVLLGAVITLLSCLKALSLNPERNYF